MLEERTADVVWIADAFVFEASENDNERFLANAEGKERPPHVMELKWREDWDDDDFSSEGKPRKFPSMKAVLRISIITITNITPIP